MDREMMLRFSRERFRTTGQEAARKGDGITAKYMEESADEVGKGKKRKSDADPKSSQSE